MFYGAHNWTRTNDLFLTKEVLYCLSYVGFLYKLANSHKTSKYLSRMERVMGIEPTLSAWEAEVLPLNYTRPCPRGEDAPTPRTGTVRHPRWERFLTDQSCDGSPSGSLHAFASEQSFHLLSRPLQSGIRFSHHPLPTASSVPLTSDLVWLDRPDAALGLPRSA